MTENDGSGEFRSGPKFMAKADMEKKLMRRFYKEVGIERIDEGYLIQLDGKIVKTPAKDRLVVMNKPMALAIVEEWDAQEEHIDPETMMLTKLANTAIDRVRGREHEIITEIVKYISSDLLCYRSESPKELVIRQCETWDTLLNRFEKELGIKLETVSGIMYAEQSEEALENAYKHLQSFDIYALSAIHNITTMLGSAVLAVSLANQYITLEDAWHAAHIDEDWQIEQWGSDEEAAARRQNRLREMRLTAQFLELTHSTD